MPQTFPLIDTELLRKEKLNDLEIAIVQLFIYGYSSEEYCNQLSDKALISLARTLKKHPDRLTSPVLKYLILLAYVHPNDIYAKLSRLPAGKLQHSKRSHKDVRSIYEEYNATPGPDNGGPSAQRSSTKNIGG